MRLPNGYGQITKLKRKNLRKPFRVRVIARRDDTGKPIYATLGYYRTLIDAQDALKEYNNCPIDLTTKDMTLDDVYKLWYAQYQVDKGVAAKRLYEVRLLWENRCDIKHAKIKDIRPSDIRKSLMRADLPKSIPIVLKGVYNQVFDYAVKEQIIHYNVSRQTTMPKAITTRYNDGKRDKKAFTDQEILKIKQAVPHSEAAAVLYYSIFSGWRPSEAIALTPNDINIKMGYVSGGMKTKAGRNRAVPIHPEILHILKSRMSNEKVFGFNKYASYRNHFYDLMDKLGIADHTPHDARRTFVTLAKQSGMDEYALKRIIGHVITDLTESVYTDRPLSFYQEEMLKIKAPDEKVYNTKQII